MKYGLGLLLTLSFTAGCATFRAPGGTYQQRGQNLYSIAGHFPEDLYEAAFDVCRLKHQAGYRVAQAPYWKDGAQGNQLEGTFRCTGEVDELLAANYEHRRTNFTEVGPAVDGRQQFSWRSGR